jgi:predicted RNase H-like nuclease (RuvC/YqgF family)
LKVSLDSAEGNVQAQSQAIRELERQVASSSAQSKEDQDLRQRVAAAEAEAKKFETEYSILEWTNIKLKNENVELTGEISRLKDEMASEFKRFRDQLALFRG